MATLTLYNVDTTLLAAQVRNLLDLAYQERVKGENKDEPKRVKNSRELEAVLDMLSDGTLS